MAASGTDGRNANLFIAIVAAFFAKYKNTVDTNPLTALYGVFPFGAPMFLALVMFALPAAFDKKPAVGGAFFATNAVYVVICLIRTNRANYVSKLGVYSAHADEKSCI